MVLFICQNITAIGLTHYLGKFLSLQAKLQCLVYLHRTFVITLGGIKLDLDLTGQGID